MRSARRLFSRPAICAWFVIVSGPGIVFAQSSSGGAIVESRGADRGGGKSQVGISVLAIADRRPASTHGAIDYKSNILIRAFPDGATLGQITVRVLNERGKLARVFHVNGQGLPQIDITKPPVFRGQHVHVRAQVRNPQEHRRRWHSAVAETVVVYRPHLTLEVDRVPETLIAGFPGTFTFSVGEDNGDLAGTARLSLSEGPAIIAESELEVPAGSTVSPSLTASFASVGTHTVTATLTLLHPVSFANPGNAQRVTLVFSIEVTPASVTGVIDTSGGVIAMPHGAILEIPQGALDAPTTIEILVTDLPAPPGVTAFSPVYQFLPEGLLFARPVKVSLPVPGDVTSGSMYWSRLGEPGFDAIGGALADGTMTAETAHFSLAFVGTESATRTITGVGQTTWISASTRVNEPIDFTSEPVEALVVDPSSGTLTVYPGIPGTGAAAGTFTVPDVPQREYILRSGAQYLVTTTNTPDLGRLAGGRPASERTALTSSSVLDLTVSGLEPWETGDHLEFFSTEANDWDFVVERHGSLNSGDTTTFLALDIRGTFSSGGPPSLIEGSKGDRAYLAQIASRTSPTGVPYLSMSRVAPLPQFDLPPSGSTPIAAAMTDVSQSNAIAVDYRGTQFRDAVLQGNPSQEPDGGGFFGVLAQPGTAEDGFYSSNADLLLVSDDGGQDLNTGAMLYGSPSDTPLAGNWGTLVALAWSARVVPPALPGTIGVREPAVPRESITWTTTTATAEAGPVVPPVTAPVGITVNGQAFYSGGSGIGMTPTLAWSKPIVSDPVFYRIVVSELFANAQNRTDLRAVANILTPNTTFTLPPGILQSGRSYVIRLTAVASTSAESAALLASAPFKSGLDIASATTVSGVFIP